MTIGRGCNGPVRLEATMKFKTSVHLNNWYGITANAGDEIEIPENLIEKARSMDFLSEVKAKKRAKNID